MLCRSHVFYRKTLKESYVGLYESDNQLRYASTRFHLFTIEALQPPTQSGSITSSLPKAKIFAIEVILHLGIRHSLLHA